MFRLIHISDVHLTPMPDPKLFQLFNKRITGWLNWRLNRKGKMGNTTLQKIINSIKNMPYDHMVITGDLVNLALPIEFINARIWLEQLGNIRDISVVFGNHDAYVPGALKTAIKTFAPWIEGDVLTHEPFPYMRIRQNIAIIGCSSAVATMPFRATGKFGKRQADVLKNMLSIAADKNLFRVVMIHHPPIHNATYSHKILKDIDCFQEVVAECGADLILHGHTHLPTLYTFKGRAGDVPVVGVASASQSFGGNKPSANYNLFEIENINGKWENTLKRYTVLNDNNDIACSQTVLF